VTTVVVAGPGHVGPVVTRVDVPAAELAAADAVVLLTDHDAFDGDEIARHARYVLDCRRVLHAPGVETL
jgi:UDP-N-acetyl-D-glucosamine dehydrogenase